MEELVYFLLHKAIELRKGESHGDFYIIRNFRGHS